MFIRSVKIINTFFTSVCNTIFLLSAPVVDDTWPYVGSQSVDEYNTIQYNHSLYGSAELL